MKEKILFFSIMAWGLLSQAQNSVFILQVRGDVQQATSRSLVSSLTRQSPLKQGGEIKRGATIDMPQGATLTCIDTEGNTYVVTRRGTVTYEQLIGYKRATPGVTAKYMQRLMAELNSNYRYTSKSQGGGSIRIDQNSRIGSTSQVLTAAHTDTASYMMTFPMDSSYVHYGRFYTLKWNPKDASTADYFVFIKKKEDAEFTRIPVSGITTLNTRGKITIRPDQEWIWAVSDQESPDMAQLRTFSFKTLSPAEYLEKTKDYNSIAGDMRRLGFSKEEADEIANRILYLECNVSQ